MLGNDIVDQLAKRAAKEGADSTDAILPTADVKIDKKQLIILCECPAKRSHS